MLQHPAGAWSWGRYVVVHPARNPDVTAMSTDYRELLADDSTFATWTLEGLLGTGALATRTTSALRKRYLPA
jgi:hypothetical protein